MMGRAQQIWIFFFFKRSHNAYNNEDINYIQTALDYWSFSFFEGGRKRTFAETKTGHFDLNKSHFNHSDTIDAYRQAFPVPSPCAEY